MTILEGGDALEQVVQVCPIPGGVQSQAGWVPGQPDLEVGNPAYGGGLELSDL